MAAVRICALTELNENEALRVEIDGVAIALVKDSAGDCHAIGDTCTHGDISLAEGFVEDDTLECWAHGSKFSLLTGKPLTLPAYEPVPVYELSIVDGDIYIDPTLTKEIA
ncbi:non-heme iron oxygenase ferredoxin subunit [Subtercola endophyticus]|uniref:non-heme iron oxygenase ferredoxin subunit n=1 Tax=Subtercola endophyticus TaxID=2895559 RepID=UPI001E4C05F7|nr:non-heme iron oxygenase ferredoxin subunit [Subtercola endophyticus]UFS60352.1 non-heme iron oxygenase ferredoxin subunit [Subtercola endophyticus]